MNDATGNAPTPTADPITDSVLENWFTYHDDPTAAPKYASINAAALALAKVVRDNCPPSADRTAAIRQIREARMTANAAIACGGK
jgi:hypothetical protein